MAKGAELGMQTFDQHLLNLYRANTIKLATACEAASNPHDFANQLALCSAWMPRLRANSYNESAAIATSRRNRR